VHFRQLLNLGGRPTLLLLIASLALLFLAACGDDDDGTDSPTPTEAASETAGGPTVSGGPTATSTGPGDAPEVCTGEHAQQGTITTLDFDNENGLYDSGEAVEITLTIANCGDNDIELSFSTAQRYEMLAQDENGNEVWNSADGQSYDQVEGQEIIEPNETVVYTETWDQAGRDGQQVPDGQYKISAFSIGCARGTQGNPDCQFGPIKFIRIGEPPETAES
jgi:hypothetical protein